MALKPALSAFATDYGGQASSQGVEKWLHGRRIESVSQVRYSNSTCFPLPQVVVPPQLSVVALTFCKGAAYMECVRLAVAFNSGRSLSPEGPGWRL